MEDIENKKDQNGSLGIDKLVSNLENIKHDPKRLTPAKVSGIIRQIANEIPFAASVIPITLADTLLADAPQKQTDLTLNEVVILFAETIFNPKQKNNLTELVQTYIHNRKKAEKEYASSVLVDIVTDNDLRPFPERARSTLKDLAHSIVEKVISEKQLRKAPDYIPQTLFSIVEPIIYHRLYNVELERTRATQQTEFRKFVNLVAQSGYEKVLDNNKLLIILNEKKDAFLVFKNALINSIPSPAEFHKLHQLYIFLQKDKIQHHEQLKQLLDSFLKPEKGMLSRQLQIRFTDKLRKNFHHAELNLEIYQSEDTIKQAHSEVYKQIQYEAHAIKNLIAITDNIQKNYKRRTLYLPVGKKYLLDLESTLTDVLLGNVVVKPDLITLEKRAIRDSGYPLKTLVQLYSDMEKKLAAISTNVSGLFSAKLQNELARAIDSIQLISRKLKPGLEIVTEEVTEEVQIKAEKEKPTVEVTEQINQEKVESRAEIIEESKPQPLEVTPPPLKVETTEPIVIEKIEPQPLKIEEAKPVEKIEAQPLQVESTEEPSVLEKVEPQPLKIEVQAEKAEPQPRQVDTTEEPTLLEEIEPKALKIEQQEEKVEPQPLQVDTTEEPIILEKIEPQPLKIEEEEAEKVEPQPLLVDATEEPTPLEKIEPRPLKIEEQVEKVEPQPLQVDTTKEPTPFEKIEPQPLKIEEQPTEKIAPQPLKIEVTEEPGDLERVEPQPLKIAEQPTEIIEPQPLKIEVTEEPSILEKVESQPLKIEEEKPVEIESPSEDLVETESYDQETQTAIDAGIVIMKNYQLADFEKPILQAWKKMITAPAESTTDIQGGTLVLPTDNEVRLYVICDLAQQVSAIQESKLNDDQKQTYLKLKTQLLEALKNPLDESNWDYFEGMQRDIIDATLGSLQ